MKKTTSKRWISTADKLRDQGYAVQYNWQVRTKDLTLDCVRIINKGNAKSIDVIVQSWVHHGSDQGYNAYMAHAKNSIPKFIQDVAEATATTLGAST